MLPRQEGRYQQSLGTAMIDHSVLAVKSLKCVFALANESCGWMGDALVPSVAARMFGRQDVYSLSAGLSLR